MRYAQPPQSAMRPSIRRRTGVSLSETTLALVIATVVLATGMFLFRKPSTIAKNNACAVVRETLNIQATRFYHDNGRWPSAGMTELYPGSSVPVCPVDGTRFRFSRVKGLVEEHQH